MLMARKEFRFTGWHMLALLIGFFGVTVGVNITLAVMASKSWTGLVVENSYVASQQFNEMLAAARAQKALGWQESLSHDNGRLSVTFKDAAGAPITGLEVRVKIGHPVAAQFDREFVLPEFAPGIYSAPSALGLGQWNADVVARSSDGKNFLQSHRFMVN